MEQVTTSFIDKLQFNESGLIPAISQDWRDGVVLMMAWMNKQSLIKTIDSGEVHYWSRSRNEIWHKGETSGHIQKIKEIRFDCDSDALLLTIEQIGSISCHKGKRSCFYQKTSNQTNIEDHIDFSPSDACSELFQVIEERKKYPLNSSYTNSLFEGGDNKILKKIGEEAVEFVMACKDKDHSSIANEAADLIFHLQVALSSKDVEWTEVLEILARRRGAPRRA